MAYDYEGRLDFRGDREKVLAYAQNQLELRGMKVHSITANQVYFENPACSWNTERQILPLMARVAMVARDELARKTKHQIMLRVSRGVITWTGSALTVQAEFSNAQMAVNTIIRLTLLGTITTVMMGIAAVMWVYTVPMVVIPLVALLAKDQPRGVSQELEALLTEIAEAGEEGCSADRPEGKGR